MPIGTDVKQYLAVDLRFSKLAASRKVDGILVIGRLFKTIRLGKLRSHKSPNPKRGGSHLSNLCKLRGCNALHSI
ncbi:hypothetical protein L596_004374 [Steinernema carpocapsae]|uniref:Uncharacterized protein n=1 Tax=Steinernema carpocapsae TaxID=34508 RepID=A0A4U8UVL6_STECR|nr:hypothetical protein L596_004374 [Steinernema carpocapsae]